MDRPHRDKHDVPLDPVVAAYMRDVDRTLLRENLKLTHEGRFRRLIAALRGIEQMRGAARERK